MTTDKKSRLSERFKTLRDKVAEAIAAAEEEEASVAEAVSSEGSAQTSPEPVTEKAFEVHRASNDEIASALMKFTWASDDQPSKEETPEEVKVFFEESHTEIEPETKTDTKIPEEAPCGKAEQESVEEIPAEMEAETESAKWDRIIAEAEALIEEDEPSVQPSVSGEDLDLPYADGGFSAEEKESGTDLPNEPEQDELTEILAEFAASEEPEPQAVSEKNDGFNWAGLLTDIRENEVEEPELFEPEPAETVADIQPETEPPKEQDDDYSEQVGAGFAALLANLRNKDNGKRSEEVKAEEPPDISMFLQEFENATEPDPSDVARLWEPRSERIASENRIHDPSVDPIKEETHVFTEEDLQNIPKDDSADKAGETSSSLSEYRETDLEEEGYTPRDFRPIRRRRYYRTGLVGGIMYFLFVVCVSVALACFAWLAADDMLSLNKEYVEAEVYVGEDMDVEQVATELQTKGLIRYRRLFALFGKFFHAEEKIEPGTYNLSTKLDYRALIQNMHHYTGWTGEELATVKVTIPEGKTVMETFQILAEHGVCPYETLMECAADETFDYSFLSDIPKGDATRLEGYLFPDTYEFYADSSPKAAICRFLDNFGDRIGDRVTEQAAAQGYTLREILTVASLIEKEAGNDLERATIASVIYNRLQSTSYPYLQIDATIQYAMGEHKEHLTNEDLLVDSPYNTYLYPGLPPGPIANPGLASIRAALNPESTGYYFYALNKNGKHEFFSSYSAFERFINSSNFGG